MGREREREMGREREMVKGREGEWEMGREREREMGRKIGEKASWRWRGEERYNSRRKGRV